ncbi:conserved hypothetical protein [Ruegeria sp. TrichCH4B]|nr:conserved hypothetical protein [Ruegeria sp. TrichCH4B]
MLDRYQKNPDVADLIAEEIAPARGFFSIWMTVFANYPDMLNRFIDAFPSTDSGCFDTSGQPVARHSGRF